MIFANEIKDGTSPPESQLAKYTFTTPGSHSSLTGTNGEIISIVRNSTARYELNGQEVIAGVNEARVDEDGLIIEPACTQEIVDPDNLKSGNWIASNAVIDASDVINGTASFIQKSTVDVGLTAHILLQAHALAGGTTTISAYIGFDSSCRYYSIADNGGAHKAFYDGQLGVVVSVSGATARAEMQHMGVFNITGIGDVTVYRLSLTCTPAAGLTFAGYLSTDGTTQTFIGTGNEHVWIWRPQTEVNEFATSWCQVSRDADIMLVSAPNPTYEWSFEIDAIPCGPQKGQNAGGKAMGWNRGAHMPLFGFNQYVGNNSIEGYVNGGAPVTSVYDTAGAEKHDTGTALAAGNWYVGWRRLTFASNGSQRPSVYIDGIESTPTVAGAGTGVFRGFPLAVLYLGATSTGIVGGFKLRSVTISDTYVPPTPPLQAFQYAWPFDRGYVSRQDCIPCVGNSNTQGSVDFANLTPYPQLLQNALPAKQFHNYGVGSNGSQMALERFRLDVVGKFYSEMILFIGINDTNAKLPAQTTIDNIETIVTEAIADGITKILLCTLMPDGLAPSDPRRIALNAVNTAIHSMCTSNPTNLVLADIYALVDDPGNPGTMLPAYDFDGGSLHLNQAGQNAVAAYLETLL